MRHLIITLALIATASAEHVLWSDAPVVFPGDAVGNMRAETQYWERNVYPIGNGRLGGTLFGDPARERLQFNEDSMWVGNEDQTTGPQKFQSGTCAGDGCVGWVQDTNPAAAYTRRVTILRVPSHTHARNPDCHWPAAARHRPAHR